MNGDEEERVQLAIVPEGESSAALVVHLRLDSPSQSATKNEQTTTWGGVVAGSADKVPKAADESYETRFHVLVPDNIDGALYISGEGPSLGNDEIQNAVPMQQGCHPGHWMSPTIRLQCPGLKYSFVIVQTRGMLNPFRLMDSQKFIKDSKEPNVTKPHRHNFVFPSKKSSKEFQVNSSREEQMSIFVQHLARSVGCFQSLLISLEDFRNLVSTIVWDREIKKREKPQIEARLLLSSLACVIPEMCGHVESEAAGWRRVFVSIVGCFVLAHHHGISVHDTQLNEACSSLLSCFDGFTIFAGQNRHDISLIPSWAVDAIKKSDSVVRMAKLSSHVSFEWIRQLPGILVCHRSLSALCRAWQAPRGYYTAPRNRSVPSPGTDQEYISAVESILNVPRVIKALKSLESDETIRFIISAAPGVRSIFALASHSVFCRLKGTLCSRLQELFKDIRGERLAMIKVLRFEWDSRKEIEKRDESEQEGAVEETSIKWGSASGWGPPVRESHPLVSPVGSILVESVKDVGNWPGEDQVMYVSFVQDQSVFENGLLDFMKILERGRMTLYRVPWPSFIVESLFLNMLPGAVESCKDDKYKRRTLFDLCEKWLEERFRHDKHKDGKLSARFIAVNELMDRLEDLDDCQDFVDELAHNLLTSCQKQIESKDVVEVLECCHAMMGVRNHDVLDSYIHSAKKSLNRCGLRRPSTGSDWNRARACFDAVVPRSFQENHIPVLVVDLMDKILDDVSPFTEPVGGRWHGSTLACTLGALVEGGAAFWERVIQVQVGLMAGEGTHDCVIRLVSEVDEIVLSVAVGDITVADSKEIIKRPEGMQSFCRGLVEQGGFDRYPVEMHVQELDEFDANLDLVKQALQGVEEEMGMLRDFVERICSPLGAHNVTREYLDILRQRERDLPSTPLNKVHSDESGWRMLSEIVQHAKRLHPFSQSMIFISALQSDRNAVDEEPDYTMADCIELINPAFERYQDLWRPFVEEDQVLLSHAISLMTRHRGGSIEEEFRFAVSQLGDSGSPNVESHVRDLEAVRQALEDEEVCGFSLASLFQLTENLWSLDRQGDMHGVTASILHQWGNAGSVLHEFAESYRQIRSLAEGTCPDDWDLKDFLGLLFDLSAGRDMVDFVKEIGDEDIRMLSDSVEDSDSFIREDTVACFIAVKGFVNGLVVLEGEDIETFMQSLSQLLTRHSTIDNPLAPQLKLVTENIFAIKSLYERVSDRGEFTKVVVQQAMTSSTFAFETDGSGNPDTQRVLNLKDAIGIQKVEYSMADLQDYRSRALLLIDTPDRLGNEGSSDDHNQMEVFIQVVDLSVDIVALLKALANVGHFAMYDWERSCACRGNIDELVSELMQVRTELVVCLEGWKEHLQHSRQKYYVLNFLRSRQITYVWNKVFKERTGWGDVKEVLSALTPAVMQKERWSDIERAVEAPEDKVIQLGQWLTEELADLPPRRRPIRNAFVHTSACLQDGEPLVGICDKEHIFNVILSVYAASGFFPEPGELLLCNDSTDWEDIELLLLRCQFSEGTSRQGRLFCLAGVEGLLVEVQTKVVDYIAKHMSGNLKPHPWKLAILSRSKQCFLVDQFKGAIRSIKAMSDEEVGQLFAEQFEKEGPHVVIVTSEAAGMGKTDRVKEIQSCHGGDFVTVPISGPLLHHDLVQETKRHLAEREASNVHLDVSGVSHIAGVDSFLFELIVLNHIASKERCLLLDVDQHTIVSIELANTLCEELRLSMHFCELAPLIDAPQNAAGATNSGGSLPSFCRQHLMWDLSRLKVSQELNSDVQVVCHHLEALLNSTFANVDLRLDEEGMQPLNAERCRTLLQRDFCEHVSFPSFSVLTAFLKVFAWQLRSLSLSCYFMVDTLVWARRNPAVRLDVLRSLLEVSRHFTIESSSAAFLSQQQQASLLEVAIEERMAERVQRLIGWEDNNHLMLLFNQGDGHSITAVYRSVQRVPRNVTDLILSQQFNRPQMPNFAGMRHGELCKRLGMILGLHEIVPYEGGQYVLTPDNFLKMVLLHARIRSNVPVVIMGETGCGKTSLIRYLAQMSQVQFWTLNIHAGTSRKAIRDFIDGVEAQSLTSGEEVWAFLDEINTCSELGMINDLVCHNQIDGRVLRPSVTILVACNPYRVKDRSLPTAGYELSRRNRRTELVYSVHPLPETMMAYVWDYGELNKEAQRLYLTSMLEDSEAKCLEKSGLLKATTEVLLLSQEFIRRVETPWSTSLRDFKRWILLFSWFRKKLLTSPKSKEYNPSLLKNAMDFVLYGGGRNRGEKQHQKEIELRSVVLALAICYYMRLAEVDLRTTYLEQISAEFAKHKVNLTPREFHHILHAEQADYIARMTLPRGIAKNRALLENVFAGIVCILNRLPLFMVGKPGCSKSLSLQLIHSNLRGPDSSEELFRTFPQIIFVSFQGSETSTSDGILKIFDKAKKFLKPDGRTMPVVLLDEIGLAEISPHNPLKVLHSLLEPSPHDRPDVAVVGISNWALDAAKMNRAIILSRPDPRVQDLEKTADAIKDSIMGGTRMSITTDDKIKKLAREYHRHASEQPVENFHGLRDFYSLIKSLCEKAKNWDGQDLTDRDIGIALARSFGGLEPQITEEIINTVLHNIGGNSSYSVPVKYLIKDSIQDKTSRHLMLITKGDFVLDVLKNDILEDISPIVMYGSTFPEDDSDNYTYRVLSRIRLCLGEGRVLVLKNLDKVYGALYDMLNQNYTEVGGRKYCRIALGAHNNPMCHVHPDFRCIVFMDHSELNNADPPFLNRFEKQHLDLDFIFNKSMRAALRELEQWVEAISSQANSTPADAGQAFGPQDMFAGLNEITLKSLVLRCSRDLAIEGRSPDELLVEACKNMLSKLAFLDGVVRAKWSVQAMKDPADVREWCANYFLTRPTSLKDLLSRELVLNSGLNNSSSGQGMMKWKSSRLVVMTELPVKPQTIESLADVVQVERYQLHTLTSERSISEVIKDFFSAEAGQCPQLLMFEASSREDGRAFQLLRFLVDQQRTKYLAQGSSRDGAGKHVCVVIQMDRGYISQQTSKSWQFHFLSGWDQVLVCDPDGEDVPAEKLLNDSLLEILTTETLPLRDVIGKVLFRCFLCQKYDQQVESVGHIKEVVSLVRGDSKLMDHLCMRVEKALEGVNLRRAWQHEVACSRAKVANSGGVLRAAELFVEERVKNLVAKLIFVLEKGSNLKSYFRMDPEMKEIWRDVLMDDGVVSIDSVPDPEGFEHFSVGRQLVLGIPFVHTIIESIQSQEELYRQGKHGEPNHSMTCSSIGEKILFRLETTLNHLLVEQLNMYSDVYVSDFIATLSDDHFPDSAEVFRSVFMRALHQEKVLLEEQGGFVMGFILAHFIWWGRREEICSLVQLICVCPGLLQHLDGLSEEDEVTNRSILRLTLHKIRSDLDAIENQDKAQRWVHESDGVLTKLNALKDRMTIGEKEILADHQVVVNFVRAISGSENWDCRCIRTVQQLEAYLGLENRLGLRCADGIHSLWRVLEELLNVASDPAVVDALRRSMSGFLSSCFEGSTSTQAQLDCYVAAWDYILQDPVPPCSLSIVVSMLNGIKADLGGGVEHQRSFALALHLLGVIKDGHQSCVAVSLATMLQAASRCDVDSHAMALLADGLQVFAFDDFACALFDGQMGMSAVRTYMGSALGVLSNPGVFGNVQVVAAAAFLRAVLERPPFFFCQWAGQGGSSTTQEGGFFFPLLQQWWRRSNESGNGRVAAFQQGLQNEPEAVKVIFNVLSDAFGKSQSGYIHALHEHMLKILRRDGLSIRQIRELSADLRQAGILGGNLMWNPLEGNDKVKSHGFNLIPGFSEAQAMIAGAIQTSAITQTLSEALKNATESVEQRAALVAATVALLYLPRFWRQLDEEENSFVQRLAQLDLKWPALDSAMLKKFALNDFAGTPLEATQSADPDDVQSIVFQIHLILCVIVGEPTSPLSLAWQAGDELARSYVPTMPTDDVTVALQAVELTGGGGARYQCGKCNFIFSIGNCGQPNQSADCPHCKNRIGGGGSNIRLQHARAKPAQPGYITPVTNESLHGSVRNLTPFAFRVLRLWLHTVMRWGFFFEAHRVQVLNGSAEKLEELHTKDWMALQGLLPHGVGRERGNLLLNALVSRFGYMLRKRDALSQVTLATSQGRDTWEDRFMAEVFQPICEDIQGSLVDYTARIGMDQAHGLEARIDELEESSHLQKLLRTRQPISMEVFRQQFHGNIDMATMHPLIAHVLDALGPSWDGHVLVVSHLCEILRWTRAVQSELNRKITREEGVKETVEGFLAKHPGLEELYEAFESAWNSSRHVTTRFECTELEGGIPEMTRQSSIAMSLYEKRNQGLYLAALIAHLVHVQNTFLQGSNQAIADTQLSHPEYRSNGVQEASIHALQKHQLLDIDMDQIKALIVSSGFIQWETGCGRGLSLEVNMHAIEGSIMEWILGGPCLIAMDAMEEVVFLRENFLGNATMLADVASKCKQLDLDPDQVDAFREEMLTKSEHGLVDFFTALEVIMCVLKRTGCAQKVPIVEFVEAWIDDHRINRIFAFGGGGGLFSQVLMESIVGWYELVEELLGAGSCDEIRPKFRQAMGESLQAAVLSIIRVGRSANDGPKLKTSAFQRAVSQFIFRFLSAGEDGVRADVPLSIYLCDPRCVVWPSSSVPNHDGVGDVEDIISDMLPDELLVGHCYALLQLLKGVDE